MFFKKGLEKAKKIALKQAKKVGKVITKIEENDEYWRFKAEFLDGHKDMDDGAGSVYISKKDYSVRKLMLWDLEFTRNFNSTCNVIYEKKDNL